MQFLYLLEKIRNPILDFIFSLITHLGEETVFLAVAIFFFWCVDKREGYYILITGLIGTVVNQILKLTFRIDRPWVKDPNFTIVESARAEATGYSFPSGHTQNIAGTFGCIGAYSKRRKTRILSVSVIILVAFSRMYLGVHTPWDVLVSLAVAAALVIGLYPIFANEEAFRRAMPWLIAVCAALSLGFLLYANLVSPEGLDPHNYESARKNASTLFGCFLGLVVVYPVDLKFTNFRTDGVWYAQLIKLVLGLGLVLLIKSTIGKPIETLVGLFTESPVYIARAIRYFLIVIFAGLVWPLTFKFFVHLRIPFMDSFTEKLLSLFKKRNTGSTDAE